MASRVKNAMLLCAMASAAATAAADRLPGFLEYAPPRPISARFNMPDWVSYAGRCFDLAEDELLTLHPRVDASASNVGPVDLFADSTAGSTAGPILDKFQTGVTRPIDPQIAPSPVSDAIRAAANRAAGEGPITIGMSIRPDMTPPFGPELPSIGTVSTR